MREQSKYLLVIEQAPAELRKAVRQLQTRSEYANLKLAILTGSPRHYAAKGIAKVIACNFDSDEEIQRALEPIVKNIVGVICRSDRNIQHLRRVVPFLPHSVRVASAASLQAATNKQLMRTRLAKHFPAITPLFMEVHDASDATVHEVGQKLGWPVIIKPAALAASLLIQACNNRVELQTALVGMFGQVAAIYRRERRRDPPQVIVEQYMEGRLYSIDAYVMDRDEVFFCPPVAYSPVKHRGVDDFFLYKRVLPSDLTTDQIADANEVAAKALHAVGLKYSSAHVELILTHGGWKVIELGPRLGRFRHRMYQKVYGIDHSLNDVLIHLGERPALPGKPMMFVAAYSPYPEKEGKFKKITSLEKLRKKPQVFDLKVFARPGDPVRFAKNGGQTALEFMFASPDKHVFDNLMDFVEKQIKIVVD